MSGISHEERHVVEFREAVMGGSWETALQLLERLGIEGDDRVKQAKFLVLEQKFLEVRTYTLELLHKLGKLLWHCCILQETHICTIKIMTAPRNILPALHVNQAMSGLPLLELSNRHLAVPF